MISLALRHRHALHACGVDDDAGPAAPILCQAWVTSIERYWVTSGERRRPHQREEVVAAESMEESDVRRPPGAESTVSVEPAGLQSLPAERKPGEIVTYQYRGAMLNYLQRWMDQLKWQRLAIYC